MSFRSFGHCVHLGYGSFVGVRVKKLLWFVIPSIVLAVVLLFEPLFLSAFFFVMVTGNFKMWYLFHLLDFDGIFLA